MKILQRLSSPKFFYQKASQGIPWLAGISLLFLLYGIIAGLFLAPIDYQQKEAFRIIYVHVPCAFLSLFIYVTLGVASFVFLVWRIKIADVLASVSAPIGATFTFLALLTGSIWGKPMWGTYWIWDARLTSELILLFLYMGYLGLRSAIRDPEIAGRSGAILALVGLVDVPIIHYSVNWWNTLHQGATISKFNLPSIATPMLIPLLAMIIGLSLFGVSLVLVRARTEILKREKKSSWVSEFLLKKAF